jgi:hypothetical protein
MNVNLNKKIVQLVLCIYNIDPAHNHSTMAGSRAALHAQLGALAAIAPLAHIGAVTQMVSAVRQDSQRGYRNKWCSGHTALMGEKSTMKNLTPLVGVVIHLTAPAEQAPARGHRGPWPIRAKLWRGATRQVRQNLSYR